MTGYSSLALFLLLIVGCRDSIGERVEVFDDAITIEGRIYDSSNKKDVEFSLNDDRCTSVAKLLSRAKEEGNPAKWVQLGNATAKNKSSREITIRFYKSGDDELAYKINDTYYRGPSIRKFLAAVN